MALLTLNLLLNRLEAVPDTFKRRAQPGFDLAKFLGDQRQSTQQVVQVLVDLSHAAGDESHLALHAIHGGDGSVDINLGLLL